jgi:hypothetical protein
MGPLPVETDNRPRPEDGSQDLPQDTAPVVGNADGAYDPDRDGIEQEP